jgi:hypothetical protein
MSKMGSHDPFGHLKHKLWPKVKNRPNFLMFMSLTTYYWKVLHEGYNFVLDLMSIGGLHTKLWALKIIRVLILRNFGCRNPSLGLTTKARAYKGANQE